MERRLAGGSSHGPAVEVAGDGGFGQVDVVSWLLPSLAALRDLWTQQQEVSITLHLRLHLLRSMFIQLLKLCRLSVSDQLKVTSIHHLNLQRRA